MEEKYRHFELEDYLLDDDFFRIVKSHFRGDDLHAWNEILKNNPEKKAMLKTAYQIINGIRIKEIQVEEKQITADWNTLQGKFTRSKRRYLIHWIYSSVACLILAIAGFYFWTSPDKITDNRESLLNILTEIETESNDIQLILGNDRKTLIEENATIKEKEDGSFSVNNDTRIEADETVLKYIQLIVPKGKRSYLELKDGSRIWVNSGTKLLYPSHFNNDNKREIYVDGEVYLEVASNASSPFHVHTAALNVKVLGTSFNVSAYSDDQFTEVVLVTGSVEVEKDNKTTSLIPNTCYHLEDSEEQVKTVDVYNYISWKEGIIKVNGEELRDIFKRLSRYYNVNITVPSELEQVRYYGKLGLEDDIEQVLHNISLVEPIGFERKADHIYIHRIHK